MGGSQKEERGEIPITLIKKNSGGVIKVEEGENGEEMGEKNVDPLTSQ